MVNELRIYRLHPGKLDAMLARFHGVARTMFARHGITVLHAWHNPEDADMFVVLFAFADFAARERAWIAFHADPDFDAQVDEQKSIIAEIVMFRLMEVPLTG